MRYLRLTSTYGNAATTWLELNGTDLDENPVLKSMFDAWNGNSSDPRVHGSSSAYEVTFGGTPADLQTVDDFLQSRGRAHGSVPIRYQGDFFLLSDGLIVC